MSEVTLTCGDCLQLIPTLKDHSIDCVLTDPPYLMASIGGGGIARTQIYNSGALDDLCNHDPTEWLTAVEPKMRTVNVIACCSRDQLALYAAWSVAHGYTFDVHIWYKSNAPPFIHGTFKSDIEYIALVYEPGRTFNGGQAQAAYSKVYQSATVKGDNKNGHSTTKPLTLMRKYISILTKPGDAVLDPFMGSGTTALACMPDRNFRGYEVRADYFAIAQKRIAAAQAQMRMEF